MLELRGVGVNLGQHLARVNSILFKKIKMISF
jgi:hypothetical protein